MNARRYIALIALSALAVSAFTAASASAATWTVENEKIEEGTAKGLAVNAALKAGTTATLKGKLLGQEFVLTSTALTSTGGIIYQEGTKAKDEGVLEFSSLTVDKPAGCGINSPIVTKQMTGELVDHAGSGNEFLKVFPEEGEVFATLKITGCALAGAYNVRGVVYGEGATWGTSQSPEPLAFSPTINSTMGGSLAFGTAAAELRAEVSTTLGSGLSFGADT